VKRYDEAMALQQQVADARTRLLGPNHPDTLFIQLNRAPTYLQAGQPKAALAQLEAFLPLGRRILGDKHPQVQMGYDIRGQAAEALGDKTLAIASFRELLALREAALGAQDIKTIDAAWSLEGLLRKRGERAAADELRKRYVTPLLQADPATLDEDQVRMANNIRETEAKEAQAAGQASVQAPSLR
jgi:non-specific serine/threonine protein kinase/serine/threonine-protein kinase